jgi:TonB family protein
MRLIAALLLVSSARIGLAQDVVGGIALDAATRRPLPCIEVALEDSAGVAVARTLSAPDGVFQFAVAHRGGYRFRFRIWGREALFGPPMALDSTGGPPKAFALAFDDQMVLDYRATPGQGDRAPSWPDLRESGPHFPRRLREARITGGVLMRFVVGADGRVDPSSISAVRSDDEAFTESVRVWLGTARFAPARMDGQPACALLVQPFQFTIGP